MTIEKEMGQSDAGNENPLRVRYTTCRPVSAHAMAAALGNKQSDMWLEPSVGTGALSFCALAPKRCPENQITGILFLIRQNKTWTH